MKALIMGAGGQGSPCASILSKDPEVTQIKLCDINMELLEKVKGRINSPKLVIEKVDAKNVEEIAAAAKGMDVIIDLVTPAFFLNVLKAAARAKVNYVNTAWEEYLYEGFEEHDVVMGAKLKMFDDFADNDLTAVLGCGMTSGYTTNVLIRYYADKLDTVESVKIRLAKKDTSIRDEEEILHPWNPGWNPRQALLDFVVPTYKFSDGKFIKMPEAFAEPEMWEFPEPIGRTLVSHHAHEEPFCIPQSLAHKGIKYCDFKYYVNKQVAPIVALGLGQEEKINVNGVAVSPIDVVLDFVPVSGDAFLNEDPSKFDYLDQTKLTSIMFEMVGSKDGREVTYLINFPNPTTPRQKMFDTYGTSLINVALPAAIGAKMAVEGTAKGIIHPQDMDPNRFIELMEKSGYSNKWEETVTVK